MRITIGSRYRCNAEVVAATAIGDAPLHMQRTNIFRILDVASCRC